MSKALTRATLKVILPGLAGGGLLGAALGLGLVPQPIGIACAVVLGLYVGFSVRQTRRRFKTTNQ